MGGRVYGYKNVEVKEGARRSHVEYAVDEEQAMVLWEVFTRYGRGEGLRAIVKNLNARSIPSPLAGKRGTGSWSTSALWSILRNERYRGVIVWNRREKTYRKGAKVRVRRDPAQWISVDAPTVRIVSDEVWYAAQAQMRKTASPDRKKGGRPHRYLLSGLVRCAVCGGPLTVIDSRQGTMPIKVYACAYHRERGDSVCKNALRRPVESINSALVHWFSANILSEEFVLEALKELRRRLVARQSTAAKDTARLGQEAATLRVEIDRLVDALAQADQKHEAIMRGIVERQERLSTIDGQLRSAAATPAVMNAEVERLEQAARKRLANLRAFLEETGEKGRRIIAAAFQGPIRATPLDLPEGRRYRLEGEAVIGKMMAMEVDGVSNVVSPGGIAGLGKVMLDLAA